MAHRRLPGARFSDPAECYDLIYHWKDYQAEADRLRAILQAEGVADGSRVLEAACGTGAYLAPLAQHFQVAGFDLDPSMIRVASNRLPGSIPLFQADMRDWQLPPNLWTSGHHRADALLLLFGGIGYVPPQDLPQTLRGIGQGLRPGGVLLLEPWVTPEQFQEHMPHMATYESPALKLCRQCVTRREGACSILEFHWLIARPGFPVEHVIERNELWLYSEAHLQEGMETAGFSVQKTDQGFMPDKTLYVARWHG